MLTSKIMSSFLIQLIVFVLFASISLTQQQQRPNIIFILADDLGWNDVGFTGNSELQTPNIDALAYNGRILTRHYSQAICTPSRTALFTSRYPFRTGMQGLPMLAAEPRALPIYEQLMPQYFKDLGYQTHLVGKWHLGYYDWKYTPTLRKAFDTFFGYLNGFVGYYDHTMIYGEKEKHGHDFWRNLEPQYHLRGRYVTDLLTEESIRLIEAASPKRQNSSSKVEPLFLFISHLAVHAGNPGENDLEYPEDDIDRFAYIPDIRRRKYATMVWNLDKSVGQVVKALADNEMLNNSIIVFASDNGAPTVGKFRNEGSNFPYRGMKVATFEGGVHSIATVWSKELHGKGLSRQLFHLTDWLPTLFSAAGGDSRDLSSIDGRNQWSGLLETPKDNVEKDEYAARQELVVNIDEVLGQKSIIYRNWKLVIGKNGTIPDGNFDEWIGDFTNTTRYKYYTTRVSQSPASVAFMSLMPKQTSGTDMVKIRRQINVQCNYTTEEVKCNAKEAPCLFDLSTDPCERVNLRATKSDIVEKLLAKIESYESEVKPQLNREDDEEAYAPRFGNTWFPWRGSKYFKACSIDNRSNVASASVKPLIVIYLLFSILTYWIY